LSDCWQSQREEKSEDGELRHEVIIAVNWKHEKCASRGPAHG
jgi:hypothetical protein